MNKKNFFLLNLKYPSLKFCKLDRNLKFYLNFSIYGEIYVIPRILRSISLDGLIFQFLSKQSKRYNTPVTATIVSGIVSGIEIIF